MQLEKTVEEKLNKIIKDGFVESIIEEKLKETIKATIDDCLRSYSDFGKELKTKITQSLSLGDMKLDLPSYNQLILTWITEIINNTIISVGKQQIEENLKKFFKPLEKSVYKISEIIEKFTDGFDSDGECGEITFIVDDDNEDYIYYHFDAESDKRMYECEYTIGTHNNKIFTVTIKGTHSDNIKTPVFYGFDSFIFHLYAAQIKIINDSENIEISYDY